MTRVHLISNQRVRQGFPGFLHPMVPQGHIGDIYPLVPASFAADLVSAMLSCASDAIARVRVSLRLSRARHGHPPLLSPLRSRAPCSIEQENFQKDRVGWRAPPDFRRARKSRLFSVRRGAETKTHSFTAVNK